MSSYKNQQHRVSCGGRNFHFVSYDGHPANIRKGEPATAPMWYLMRAGKRWPVIAQVTGQSEEEVVQALTRWIVGQGLDRPAAAESPAARTLRADAPATRPSRAVAVSTSR